MMDSLWLVRILILTYVQAFRYYSYGWRCVLLSADAHCCAIS